MIADLIKANRSCRRFYEDHAVDLRTLEELVDFYTESLTIDGATRSFNMLRVGRIGLYFQSDDTRITGRWDNAARQWVVDDSARNEVRKGLRMARQLIAPELINIPVPAPEA